MADAILMVVAITVLESHTYISPVRETAEEQLVFSQEHEAACS